MLVYFCHLESALLDRPVCLVLLANPGVQNWIRISLLRFNQTQSLSPSESSNGKSNFVRQQARRRCFEARLEPLQAKTYSRPLRGLAADRRGIWDNDVAQFFGWRIDRVWGFGNYLWHPYWFAYVSILRAFFLHNRRSLDRCRSTTFVLDDRSMWSN